MIRNRMLFALVPAFIASLATAEAANLPQTSQIKVDTAAFQAEETMLKNLFEQGAYYDVLEKAGTRWNKDAEMPNAVLRVVGESRIRTGQSSKALSAFEILLSRLPDDKNAQAGLAYTLVYNGKQEEGLRWYDKLLKSGYEPAALMEDGFALLAQGNSNGKVLLEKVTAYYPNWPDLKLRHQQILSWYETNYKADAVQQQAQAEPSQNAIKKVAQQERKTLKGNAIELARQGSYEEALNIFANLYESDKTDSETAFDYLTILHWAGENSKAVSIYESITTGIEIPVYAQLNASAAYYRLGDYNKALAAIKPAIDKGDRKARLFEAELYMRCGNSLKSQERYEALLAENPLDIEVYHSRAYAALAVSDYRQEAADLERAIRIIPDTGDKLMQLRRYHDDLAAAYINMGRPDKAIAILKPYIGGKSVNASMSGNYILALKDMAKYNQAVKTAKKLWPDYSQGPIFGLRALAECDIQLKNTAEAVQIYKHIVSRDPANDSHKLTLAFGLLLDGRVADGLNEYEKLLKTDSSYIDIAISDAKSFLNAEKYLQGKALFKLIIRLFPDQPVYRQEYADMLVRKQHYRAALQQYQELATIKETELAGLTGIVRTAIVLDDYKKAREAMEQITYKYGRSKTVAAISQYDSRPKGDADISYSFNKNHKGQQTKEERITAEQNVTDNYWLMTEFKRTRLDDFNTGVSGIITEGLLGFRYREDKLGVTAWPRNYTIQYDADDQRHLTLQYDKSYVMDANAVAAPGGPIMARNYSINYAWQPNTMETYQVGVSRGFFTDNNQAKSFSLNHTITLYNRNGLNKTRNMYWNRTWNKEQDVVYESPQIREGTGIGWTFIRYLPGGNLSAQTVMNWERDYPEKLSFSPYVRVEYNRDMSPDHTFTLGTEYGLRSDDMWGKGGLRFSYRQFDFLYRITW